MRLVATTFTLRQYAAHRRSKGLPGGSLQAVQEALAGKRIPLAADGQIDPEVADAAWDRNTEATKRTVAGQNGHAADPGSYIEAKRLESIERARQLRLENDETEGRLVLAIEVESLWARRVTEAQNHLRGIPSRAKLRIPGLTVADLRLLASLIDEALEELAGDADRAR